MLVCTPPSRSVVRMSLRRDASVEHSTCYVLPILLEDASSYGTITPGTSFRCAR